MISLKYQLIFVFKYFKTEDDITWLAVWSVSSRKIAKYTEKINAFTCEFVMILLLPIQFQDLHNPRTVNWLAPISQS